MALWKAFLLALVAISLVIMNVSARPLHADDYDRLLSDLLNHKEKRMDANSRIRSTLEKILRSKLNDDEGANFALDRDDFYQSKRAPCPVNFGDCHLAKALGNMKNSFDPSVGRR